MGDQREKRQPLVVDIEGDIFTIDQVAAILHVGRSTVWKLIREDGLPSAKIGRRRLVPRKELMDWVSKRTKEEG